MPAGFGGAYCAPADPVARIIKAPKGTLQTLNIRQQLRLRYEHVLHNNFSGDGSTQGEFSFYRRCTQSGHVPFQNKTANFIVVRFCPNDKDIRNGAIGNPHLCAVEPETAVDTSSPRLHATGVGAMIRFSQTKTTNPFTGGQFWQVFLTLRLTAISINRVHH